MTFKLAAADPRRNGGFCDVFQSHPEQLSITEDERGYITLHALVQGKPDPSVGIVRVPPGNVRSISHFPEPPEKKK